MRLYPTVYLAATVLLLLAGCRSAPEPSAPAPVVAETPAPEPEVVPAPAASTPAPEPPPLSDDAAITVELQTAEGAWAPLPSGRTLPAGPATLRFLVSDAGRRADIMESLLRRALEGVTADISRPDAATVQVAMPALPPRLLVHLPADKSGPEFVVYSGEPPRLVALNPATGEETAIAESPVDIILARVSPDGRWILYEAVDPEDPFWGRYWLGNTVTGQLTLLPDPKVLTDSFEAWPLGKLLIAVDHRVRLLDPESGEISEVKSQSEFWSCLSPDGRYLAGYDHDYNREISPSNIFVVDLQTETEQVYPRAVSSFVHSWWVELPMAWAPDGKSLLIEQFLTRDQRQVVRLDLATGAVAPYAEKMPETPPRTSHGWEIIYKGWSSLLKGPDGQEHQLGAGYPAGWLPDGRLLLIRWPNYKYTRSQASV